jgi:hypothetical protein
MKSKLFPKNYLQLFAKLSLEIAVFAILITLSMSVYGQRTMGRIGLTTPTSGTPTKSVLLNESATLEQCRNGGPTIADRVPCDDAGGATGWVTGNAGKSDSHWSETESLPYRMLFGGLSTGAANVHTVTIGYDFLKSGVHAIDYLTSFDRTETTGADDGTHANQNNPCDGVAGFSCVATAPTSFIAIPLDTLEVTNKTNADTGVPVPQVAGAFKMWGGHLLTIAYEPDTFGEERRITLTFTADVVNPVLAWGGHVAWQGEWGAGLSAGGISGSPYHMRLKDLDGAGGNQDRSLSADAVAIPAKVTIVKLVPFSLTNAPSVSFSFTPSNLDFAGITFGNCGGICLTPTTDQSGTTSSASFTFPAIVNNLSGLAADARTVQESVNPPTGWHVVALGCFNNGPGGTASTSVSTAAEISSGIAVATIRPVEGDNIQCTFTNSVVTAATASVTGRVTTSSGYGIRGAAVTIQDVNTGTSTTTLTNSFGYYTFTNLPVNDFYVMNVSAKRYTFSVNTKSFTLNDNLAGLDFTSDF